MSRFAKIYKRVPKVQKDWLINFRNKHHYHHINVGDRNWKYVSGGSSEQTVVLLPGSVRSAEVWSRLITRLEKDYRVLSPTYPAFDTMKEAVEGVAGILQEEGAENIFLLGASFGGWLAQVFVRAYPRGVRKLILSNTSGPGSVMSERLLEFTKFSLPKYPEWLLKRVYKRSYLKILYDAGKEEKAYWRAFMTELLYVQTSREDILNMFKAIYDYAKNYRFAPGDLQGWDGEILIIESSGDILDEDARSELKTLYPQAGVRTMQKAGHNTGYIAPPSYIRTVMDFFGRD